MSDDQNSCRGNQHFAISAAVTQPAKKHCADGGGARRDAHHQPGKCIDGRAISQQRLDEERDDRQDHHPPQAGKEAQHIRGEYTAHREQLAVSSEQAGFLLDSCLGGIELLVDAGSHENPGKQEQGCGQIEDSAVTKGIRCETADQGSDCQANIEAHLQQPHSIADLAARRDRGQ
jgi:hypothetical protein